MSTPTLLMFANSVLVMLVVLLLFYLVALGVSLSGIRNERLHRLTELVLGRNLRSSFMTGLVLLAGVLPIILGIVVAQRSAEQARAQVDDRLHDTAETLTQTVDGRMSEYLRAIDSLSRTLVNQEDGVNPVSISRELGEVREIYSGFLTMLASNADGRLIASVPTLQPGNSDAAALDISDRDYFQVPRETHQPFVSEVFRGRGFGSDPIVAISAPLLEPDGTFTGIVEASLDLTTFWDLRNLSVRWTEAHTLIVDTNNRVIHSSRRNIYPILSDASEKPAVIATATTPKGETFRFSMTDDTGIVHDYIGTYGVTKQGWKVFVKIDSHLFDEKLAANFRVTALWAVFTALLGVILASALHRRVGQPLSHLHELVTKFDSEEVDLLLKSDTRRRGIPFEFKQIFIEFRNLRRRLMVAITRQREALRESERLRIELEDVVSEREQVIARRTAELERANQLLEREAKIDPLTGLPNRRGLQEFLERAWRTAQRRHTELSVILIDVDHFKKYNDEFGHAIGDACLQEFAALLERHCRRATDLAGRWGGEEFLIAFGETSTDDAKRIAEEIRTAVEKEAVNWSDFDADIRNTLTMSAGVATTTPLHESDTIDSLINAADEALYESKHAGRNRVTAAEPL